MRRMSSVTRCRGAWRKENLQTKRAKEVLSSHARGSRMSEQVNQSKENERAIREASRGRTAIREALTSGRISDPTALRGAVAQSRAVAEPDCCVAC